MVPPPGQNDGSRNALLVTPSLGAVPQGSGACNAAPPRQRAVGRDAPLLLPNITEFYRRVLVHAALLIPAKAKLFIVQIRMRLPVLIHRRRLSRPGVATKI